MNAITHRSDGRQARTLPPIPAANARAAQSRGCLPPDGCRETGLELACRFTMWLRVSAWERFPPGFAGGPDEIRFPGGRSGEIDLQGVLPARGIPTARGEQGHERGLQDHRKRKPCEAHSTSSNHESLFHQDHRGEDQPPRNRAAICPPHFPDTAPWWSELPSRSLANCIADQHEKSLMIQPQSHVQTPDLGQTRKDPRRRRDQAQFL